MISLILLIKFKGSLMHFNRTSIEPFSNFKHNVVAAIELNFIILTMKCLRRKGCRVSIVVLYHVWCVGH